MGYFNDFMDFDGGDAYYNVPDHIDPSTGKYLPGTRKCSKCESFKTKKDFNKEQEKKPATKRICNECGPPMPKDLNSFTVAQLKDELRKRGKHDNATKGMKKAEIVALLKSILDGNKDTVAVIKTTNVSAVSDAAPTNNGSPLTLEYIQSLKVVDLKKELRVRGCPVSGLKAVLQQRLIDAADISTEASKVEERGKMPARKVEAKTKATKPLPAIVNPGSDKENAPRAVPSFNMRLEEHVGGVELKGAQKTTQNVCMRTKGKVHWKKVPPACGATEVTQNIHGRTFYWCNKCRMWTPSHNTTQHINAKKNKQKASKGPLAPLLGMPRPIYMSYN